MEVNTISTNTPLFNHKWRFIDILWLVLLIEKRGGGNVERLFVKLQNSAFYSDHQIAIAESLHQRYDLKWPIWSVCTVAISVK